MVPLDSHFAAMEPQEELCEHLISNMFPILGVIAMVVPLDIPHLVLVLLEESSEDVVNSERLYDAIAVCVVSLEEFEGVLLYPRG